MFLANVCGSFPASANSHPGPLCLQECVIAERFRDQAHLVCLMDAFLGEARTQLKAFLVYQYAGDSLQAMLKKDLPTHSQLRAVMGHVLAGLTYIHAQSLVHTDVKPANILVSAASVEWHCRLGDFGSVVEASERCFSVWCLAEPVLVCRPGGEWGERVGRAVVVMHVPIGLCIYTCTCANMYMDSDMYIWTQTCICTQTCIYIQVWYTCIYIYACEDSDIHVYGLRHVYIYTYVYPCWLMTLLMNTGVVAYINI